MTFYQQQPAPSPHNHIIFPAFHQLTLAMTTNSKSNKGDFSPLSTLQLSNVNNVPI